MTAFKSAITSWFMVFGALVLSQAMFAQDFVITTTVDRNPVGVNEQFTYQIKIEGRSQNIPEPNYPDLSDFRVLGGPNLSTSFQIINGAMSSSKTYSYILLPKKAGNFTIPAVTLRHNGKSYQSNSISLTITPQGSSPRQSGQGSATQRAGSSEELFLRAFLSKKTLYVNEPLDLSYKLYFRVTVRNPEFIKLPETVGFWVEEYEIPKDVPISQEIFNGIQYNVAELKKLALFPSKAGELTITPMQLAVNVVERRRRRDAFDLFDDFFDSPFGRTVRKTIDTEALRINVKPLPEENKPANFTGLVGDFRLSASIDKNTVPANEAVSLKLQFSGNGNLKSLGEVPIEFPSGFEVYDPKVKESLNRSGDHFSASKELEYVLIPRTPGEYTIPAIELSYFDPSERRYKTLRTQELAIKVSRGKELAGISNHYVSKSEVALLGKDIHFIKEKGLNLHPIGYKPYKAFWFWATLVLPLIFLSLAYGYQTHRAKMSSNVEYARKRTAFKQASRRLKGAQQYLKQQQFAAFYAEVSKGLIGYVADKTNQPAAGLLREEVIRLLRSKQIDERLLKEYLKYLDEADFRRFAPGSVTFEEAKIFYKKAEEILVKLGKFI